MPVYYERIVALRAYADLTRWGNQPAPTQLAYLARLRREVKIEELVADANAIARELHPLCNEIEITSQLDRIILSLELVALGVTFRVHCYKDDRTPEPRLFRVFRDEMGRS